MKNLLIIPFLILTFIANAQIKLTYETHGLMPDYVHKTQYVENVLQGSSGENQIWDFSDFKCNQIKSSEILSANDTENSGKIAFTNIAIIDDDNCFYFNVDEFGIEYYGLVTPNAIINFNEPIVKMKYPFTYGDEIEGEFTGEGIYYGEIFSNLYGDYKVEGDAYGTLLLPNHTVVNNVLRVKTINHIYETACQTTEFYNEKYLWYSADFRMPIMAVVIDKKIVNGVETVTNYGYYSEEAFQANLEMANLDISKYSLNAYPNPFSDNVNITYNIEKEAKISLEIYNTIGVRIATLVNKEKQVGTFSYNFNANEKSLAVGSYFVKLKIDDKVVMKKIIFMN